VHESSATYLSVHAMICAYARLSVCQYCALWFSYGI